MRKTIHSKQSLAVQHKLVEMRQEAGLTHRQLAERLGREHSFVWRIEHGERRVDVVEFFAICHALGQNAATAYGELTDEFRRVESEGKRPGRK